MLHPFWESIHAGKISDAAPKLPASNNAAAATPARHAGNAHTQWRGRQHWIGSLLKAGQQLNLVSLLATAAQSPTSQPLLCPSMRSMVPVPASNIQLKSSTSRT